MKKWITIFPIMATLATGSAFAKELKDWAKCPDGPTGPKGEPGSPGAAGDAFSGAYGSWYFPKGSVEKGKEINFIVKNKEQVAKVIKLENGVFTLPDNSGTYLVTLGVMPYNKTVNFVLHRNSVPVEGGELVNEGVTHGTLSTSVMVRVEKTSQGKVNTLKLINNGDSPANVSAHISILQISN